MKQLVFKEPYPKQRDFLLSRTRYTAYGEAAARATLHE